MGFLFALPRGAFATEGAVFVQGDNQCLIKISWWTPYSLRGVLLSRCCALGHVSFALSLCGYRESTGVGQVNCHEEVQSPPGYVFTGLYVQAILLHDWKVRRIRDMAMYFRS